MRTSFFLRRTAQLVLLLASMGSSLLASAVTVPATPLSVQSPAKPMAMLVAGKDHRFFYEAYNDTSDLDGDGTLDIRFKPGITYVGLFHSRLCYTHAGGSADSGLFTPSGVAGALNKCSNAWSGNWLNYVTTSRIDALRVVLYGGHRDVDNASTTVLRRAYIPQDAHSWAKEYTSETVDGYKISDYTPIAPPTAGKRHFFGNLTANATVNCATLNACSSLPPWLSVVQNSTKRVWEWASSERPVLHTDATRHGGTGPTHYTVRVAVCTSTYNTDCKRYPSGNYKPVGLLHDYGESDAMLFGLLTGSYDKNMSGGRLRKVVSSFRNEVDPTNGVFTAAATIVQTFNALRIRDFNNGTVEAVYKGGWMSGVMTPGQFPDWGNPIAEMMYEATRYFAGKATPTSNFAGAATIDAEVGLPLATWDDPYSSASQAKAPSCARGNLITISDTNVSYDSDELPGTYTYFGSGIAGDLPELKVATEAATITQGESNIVGKRYIGESGLAQDLAPTAKDVTNLGQIRGLAPDEPTKQGSYYAASIAHYAKRMDLRPEAGKQNLDTYVIALASPLPRIAVKLQGGKVVTLIPYAKTISLLGYPTYINKAKGQFQPTNQIVDYYVERVINSGPADSHPDNNGLYQAKFRINFEDLEQGADHDMDVTVEYTISARTDGQLQVDVKPISQAGGFRHRIGYIISGTTKDGVYLVVQDEDEQDAYYLNTPPNLDPGACDVASPPAACSRLPYIGATTVDGDLSRRLFSPQSGSSAAEILKDPLWYAAKWGGFVDQNGNGVPDLKAEWDADGNGVPDHYLLVQNPEKFKEVIKNALDQIVTRASSSGNVAANSTSITAGSLLFQSLFDTQRWSGNLIAYAATAAGIAPEAKWNAAAALAGKKHGDRNIFMRTTQNATVKLSTYGSLVQGDQTELGSEDIFNFIRGDRSKEQQNLGTLRNRAHVLGDIINSSPFYEKENKVVYVGANDGMLHAFDAANGNELFAFIPKAFGPRLKNLADVGYTHGYYVDGDILVTPKSPLTGNKNLLYALLGRGGKGLFSLDVSNPASPSTAMFQWEYSPRVGSLDGAADGHLGIMLGRPTHVKLKGGAQALVVGNGYNSTNGRAALYIFKLNTAGKVTLKDQIVVLPVGPANADNGLATPLVVSDDQGNAEFVYAGDLKGNIWKFDLRSTDSANWTATFSAQPLFTAKDPDGVPQPITAPLSTAVNDRTGDPNVGKRFLFFGTGSYFKTGDATDKQKQSWYAIIDDNQPITTRTSLKQRKIETTGTTGGTAARAFSTATAGDMSGKKGWFLDLATTTAQGERIVTQSKLIQLAKKALMATSFYPVSSDECSPGGVGYLNFIDPFSGASLGTDILDVNGDNKFDDRIGTVPVDSVQLGIGVPTEATAIQAPGGVVNIYVGGSGTGPDKEDTMDDIKAKGGNVLKGRISWREIVKD